MHSVDYVVARRLSVRLSHAGIVSKRLYISSKFFSTILVFPYQTGWQYFDRDPLTGTTNARGYEKNHDLRPISGVFSELIKDKAIVTMECE